MTHTVDGNPSNSTHFRNGVWDPHQAEAPTRAEKAKRFINFTSKENFADEIQFFREALLENDIIEVGSKHSQASAYSNSSTIYGLIRRLKKFIRSPHQDFNIYPNDFKRLHEGAFLTLIGCLEEDAKRLQEEKSHLEKDGEKFEIYKDDFETRHIFRKGGRYYINPSEETKKATQLLLNKLFELKFQGVGLLNKIPGISDRSRSQPPPLLQILDKDLKNLHLQLVKYPPNDQLIVKFFKNVERALSYPEQLIPGYTVSKEDQQAIAHFKKAFSEHISMPKSLKRDERFSPSYFDLSKEMLTLKNLITKRVKERTSYGTKASELFTYAKSSAKDAITAPLTYLFGVVAETLSTRPNKNTFSSFSEKPHPLTVFHDAIKYFSKPTEMYSATAKLEILEEILNECKDIYPDFEKELVEELIKNTTILSSSSERALSATERYNYIQKRLFQNLRLLSEKVLPKVLENKTPKLPSDTTPETRLSFLTNSAVDATSEKFSTSSGYLSNLLNIINNPSGELMKAPIKFMIGNFNKFIQFSIDKALSTVKDSDKEQLIALKNSAKLHFEKALGVDTLDAYKQAINAFLLVYNKLQINLDCIELPTFNRELQTLEEDPQEIITQTLAKSKNLSPVVEQESNWEVETKKQTKVLSETSTNYLMFNFIYHTMLGVKVSEESENLYYKIVAKLKSTPVRSDRKKIFLQELKEAIDNSSQSFLYKARARLLLGDLVYDTTYSRVNKFSKEMLEYFRNNLGELQSSPYEPINSKVVRQVDECTEQYQAMLAKWAFEGGNKQRYIEGLMKKGDYNIGKKNITYSQEELYTALRVKVSKTFSKGIDITELLEPIHKAYTSWFIQEVHSTSSIVSKIKTYALKAFKYLSFPVAFLSYYASYAILSILNKVVQFFSEKVLKGALKRNNVIKNVMDSAHESIYKKNHYVDIITDFLIDNLEELDLALYEEDTKRRELISSGTVPHDQVETSKIPAKTKKALKQTLLNCFQLLEKNKHLTSEELKKALQSKPQSILTESRKMIADSLDEIITPKVVDALIEVIAISSDVLFKKEHLEKQLAKLIVQINDSLTTGEVPDQDNLEKLNQIYFQNELRLSKLLDKIVKKTVNLSINEEFDRFGDRYYRENENQKIWVQTKLLGDPSSPEKGLVEQWTNLLAEFEALNKTSDKLNINDLQKQREKLNLIKFEAESLLAEFSIKLESAKESSLSKRSIEKLYTQLIVLSKNIQSFENDYLLKIYANTESVISLNSDKNNIYFLEKSYTSLMSKFEELSEEDNEEKSIELLDNIHDIHTGLDITLETLNENGISLGEHDELNSILDFHESEDWTVKYNAIFTEIKDRIICKKVLKMINPELKKLVKLKKEALTETKSTFQKITEKFRKTKEDYWDSYHKIIHALEILPKNEIYNDIKSLHLKTLVEAGSEEDIDTALDGLNDYIDSSIEDLDAHDNVDEIKNLLQPTNSEATKLLKTIETIQDKYNSETHRLTDPSEERNIFSQLEKLSAAAEKMESIQHIDVPVGVVQFLKEQTTSLVYSMVKPKADEAIELLKDENVARALVNHVILIPIADMQN